MCIIAWFTELPLPLKQYEMPNFPAQFQDDNNVNDKQQNKPPVVSAKLHHIYGRDDMTEMINSELISDSENSDIESVYSNYSDTDSDNELMFNRNHNNNNNNITEIVIPTPQLRAVYAQGIEQIDNDHILDNTGNDDELHQDSSSIDSTPNNDNMHNNSDNITHKRKRSTSSDDNG